MDIENSEDLEIKMKVEEITLSKKESIDLLKSKGIIHISIKKQETNIKTTDDGTIVYSGKYAKIIGNTLKELGNINDNCTEISSKWTIKNNCFKLSPSVEIFDSENNQMSYNITLLDNDINFDHGFIEFCESNANQDVSEVLEYFNKLISIFNILNIPFDFVHDYELINLVDMDFKNGTHKENVPVVSSEKAFSRGDGYKTIKMKTNDFDDLLTAVDLVWGSLKENDILNTGSLFIFLGYGKYYHFHGDYLLSFANTWMFIEAVISLMWEKMMRSNGFSNKYLKNVSRNWTAQIKIDELRLKGFIDEKTSIEAQSLRSIRNQVFHVSKDKGKRKIDSELSKECIDLGLSLFYLNLDLIDSGYIVSFDNIASDIENSIHDPPTILKE